MNLRYHWDRAVAEAFWDKTGLSPHLQIEARGIEIGTLDLLPSREWISLPPEVSQRIGELLAETSLFDVYGESDQPGLLLVQEEGMSHKPSLLLELSAADILRYWSLLTPAQRAAFIESRAPGIALVGQGADLVVRHRVLVSDDSVFDRFAGFFHAFGCLERAVRAALESDQTKDANYRLFGKKYDSLGSLLDRVEAEQSALDPVDSYVLVLSAQQMCREIARDCPQYWESQGAATHALQQRLSNLATLRARLIEQNGADFSDFLSWFDRWFLQRAQPVEDDA